MKKSHETRFTDLRIRTFFPITIQLETGEIKKIYSPYEIEQGWKFKVLEYSKNLEP